MKSFVYLLVIGMLTSCAQKSLNEENPLLKVSNEPFGIVSFDKLTTAHYAEAFEQGFSQNKAEIKVIAENPETPTFENTILAMEYSGELLTYVTSVFDNQLNADTNDELQDLAMEVMPKLAAHMDDMFLNEQLFQRVKVLFEKKDSLGLDAEEMKLLENTYKDFVRSGADLNPAQKEELKKINEELSMLSLRFGDNLLAETNDFKLVIENEADLSGLPETVIAGAAETAKAEGKDGKWIFTLHAPSWIPFLQYSDNRALREKLYKAMYTRGNRGNGNDNKAIVNQMMNLRLQKAQILGYKNHAEYELADKMAKTPENVYDLLNKLWKPAIANAKSEAQAMQNIIDKEENPFTLASWDWWYYAEKVRKEKYDLEDSQLSPYFEMNNVREGAFALANKLYGLTFKELDNVPVPHPDARAFEVFDVDGSHLGILFMDFYARASKHQGAWMSSYRDQHRTLDGQEITPIITVVYNFSKPVGNQPVLLSFDDVTTVFHEFGHALHGLLSDCRFPSLSGTSVPSDFVEMPSQIMENWCSEPEMLKLYAKHYQTGEIIPVELIDKVQAASKFNQGFATVEYLAASILDMDFHTETEIKDIDVEAFEKASMDRIGLIDQIIPRYKTTYFSHIWDGGYSAGYYSYIWAEMLDSDAFYAYKESGDIFNREIAKSFREKILSRGGTKDAMQMYLDFRGKEPEIEPLLEKRGLN